MAFVYDIPDAPGAADDSLQKRKRLLCEQRAAKVLGKAVHPNALRRLFELWPEAEVEVQYGRYDGRRTTVVTIIHHSGAHPRTAVRAVAACDPVDQFNRRYGIQLAFRRALTEVRKRATNA